jgi:hypothetical protein
VISLFIPVTSVSASDDWLLGKWKLYYDPDGGKTDYMEFRANGDVISTGPLGKIEGLYKVNPGSVKAVLTYKGKDMILTFHFNEKRDELRIVTSHTGRESIYRKMRN